MSTGATIAIAIVVMIVILGAVFALPRLRGRSRLRQPRDAELHRREAATGFSPTEADSRHRRVQATEHRTEIAEGEAIREHVEAQLREAPVAVPVGGLTRRELRPEQVREGDRFAGTYAVAGGPALGRRERFDGGYSGAADAGHFDGSYPAPVVRAPGRVDGSYPDPGLVEPGRFYADDRGGLVEPVPGAWDLESDRDGHAIALELQAIAARSRAARTAVPGPVARRDPRVVQAPAGVARKPRLRSARSRRRSESAGSL